MLRIIPRAAVADGVLVLECTCGAVVPYPGYPRSVKFTKCTRCGNEWYIGAPFSKSKRGGRRSEQDLRGE